MFRRHTIVAMTVLLGGFLLLAAACGDDNNHGDKDREAAADLTAHFEDFKRDLLGTQNIEQTPDDLKSSLKSNCGKLQDAISSDRLDAFCGDLGDAVDDESQTSFEELKSRFPADVDAPYRDEIADRVSRAADSSAKKD